MDLSPFLPVVPQPPAVETAIPVPETGTCFAMLVTAALMSVMRDEQPPLAGPESDDVDAEPLLPFPDASLALVTSIVVPTTTLPMPIGREPRTDEAVTPQSISVEAPAPAAPEAGARAADVLPATPAPVQPPSTAEALANTPTGTPPPTAAAPPSSLTFGGPTLVEAVPSTTGPADASHPDGVRVQGHPPSLDAAPDRAVAPPQATTSPLPASSAEAPAQAAAATLDTPAPAMMAAAAHQGRGEAPCTAPSLVAQTDTAPGEDPPAMLRPALPAAVAPLPETHSAPDLPSRIPSASTEPRTPEAAMSAPVAPDLLPRDIPVESPPTPALSPTLEPPAPPRAAPVPWPARQIAPFAVALALGPDASVTLTLEPAELGQVAVSIERTPAGEASVRVVAERPETLALLQRDGRDLERALSEAGLGDGSPSLSFSLGGGSPRDPSGGEGRGRRAPAPHIPSSERPDGPVARRGLIDLAL